MVSFLAYHFVFFCIPFWSPGCFERCEYEIQNFSYNQQPMPLVASPPNAILKAPPPLDDMHPELLKAAQEPSTRKKRKPDGKNYLTININGLGGDGGKGVKLGGGGGGSGVHFRSKRYALQGSRWSTKVLTYRITKYPYTQRYCMRTFLLSYNHLMRACHNLRTYVCQDD